MKGPAAGVLVSKVVPFHHYGLVSYQIEIDLADQLRPLQRHIFTRADGTQQVEPWIRSIAVTAESLLRCGWTWKN